MHKKEVGSTTLVGHGSELFLTDFFVFDVSENLGKFVPEKL